MSSGSPGGCPYREQLSLVEIGGDFHYFRQKKTWVKPFFITKCAIKNRDYIEFLRLTGYRSECCVGSIGWTDYYYRWGEDAPVVMVTHNDAKSFCSWIGGRLPTSIEWEFSARGSNERLFPWGDVWRSEWYAGLDFEEPIADVYLEEVAADSGCIGFVAGVKEWTATAGHSVEEDVWVIKGSSWKDLKFLSGTEFPDRYPLLRRDLSCEATTFQKSHFCSNDLGFRCAFS